MMISSRGRYALRIMIDLAENSASGRFVPLKDMASRQNISLKYMERIVPVLVKDGLLAGVQGKGGGYKLAMDAKDISVGRILRLTEGSLQPVECPECGAQAEGPCEIGKDCRTVHMWQKFGKMTEEYFDGITIADLML